MEKIKLNIIGPTINVVIEDTNMMHMNDQNFTGTIIFPKELISRRKKYVKNKKL